MTVESFVNAQRYRLLNAVKPSSASKPSCVMYWMLRSQRIHQNHSLLLSQQLAAEHKLPVKIVFPWYKSFDQMSVRQSTFMVEGLRVVEAEAKRLKLPFDVIDGGEDLGKAVGDFAVSNNAKFVVTDAFPLKTPNAWKANALPILTKNAIGLYECDSDNVVPVWVASDKQEVGARTIRKKIDNHLREFGTTFVDVEEGAGENKESIDWNSWLKKLDTSKVDMNVKSVNWLKGGSVEGGKHLQTFINGKIKTFADVRNNPNEDVASNLSPYVVYESEERSVVAVVSSHCVAPRRSFG